MSSAPNWAGTKRVLQSGLLAYALGKTDEGSCVIDWSDSEGDWDTFIWSELQPAFGEGREHSPT